jgi:hypothetical protein
MTGVEALALLLVERLGSALQVPESQAYATPHPAPRVP